MDLVSKFNPALCKKVLTAYRDGLSPGKICISFGLSERNYYDILKKYSDEAKQARTMRDMNVKKRLARPWAPKTVAQPKVGSKKKATSDDKVAHLQKRLDLEKKRNDELEALLKIAKEQLGKL